MRNQFRAHWLATVYGQRKAWDFYLVMVAFRSTYLGALQLLKYSLYANGLLPWIYLIMPTREHGERFFILLRDKIVKQEYFYWWIILFSSRNNSLGVHECTWRYHTSTRRTLELSSGPNFLEIARRTVREQDNTSIYASFARWIAFYM